MVAIPGICVGANITASHLFDVVRVAAIWKFSVLYDESGNHFRYQYAVNYNGRTTISQEVEIPNQHYLNIVNKLRVAVG